MCMLMFSLYNARLSCAAAGPAVYPPAKCGLREQLLFTECDMCHVTTCVRGCGAYMRMCGPIGGVRMSESAVPAGLRITGQAASCCTEPPLGLAGLPAPRHG